MASFTISSLLTYFKNDPKSISRGENHYESGHVTSFKYDHRYATGKVAASMKKKEYKVTIFFTENMEIESTDCECPRGAFKCSHAAALYFCCKMNVSKTDMVCQWKKSRVSEGSEVKSAEELFPGDNYRALEGTVTDEDRSWFYHELQKEASFTGMCWLMSPEPSMSVPDLPTIDSLISSSAFKQAVNKRLCFIQHFSLTAEARSQIADMTAGQHCNDYWHLIRKGRITASKFGTIINSRNRNAALGLRLLKNPNINNVKAIAWGMSHEECAIDGFKISTGFEVKKTGLWLDVNGCLGASPDGLINDDAVIEVKCPYSYRDKTIAEASACPKFFLYKDENGRYCLKKNNRYWHQIQGQLHLTGRRVFIRCVDITGIARNGNFKRRRLGALFKCY